MGHVWRMVWTFENQRSNALGLTSRKCVGRNMLTQELTAMFSFEQEGLLKEKQHSPILSSNITRSLMFLNSVLPKQTHTVKQNPKVTLTSTNENCTHEKVWLEIHVLWRIWFSLLQCDMSFCIILLNIGSLYKLLGMRCAYTWHNRLYIFMWTSSIFQLQLLQLSENTRTHFLLQTCGTDLESRNVNNDK